MACIELSDSLIQFNIRITINEWLNLTFDYSVYMNGLIQYIRLCNTL